MYCHYLPPNFLPLCDVCNTSKLKIWTNYYWFFSINISNRIFWLLLVAILFRTNSYVCATLDHNIFWAASFNLSVRSISNALYLITFSHLSMRPFNWCIVGVIYSKVTASFSHIFYNFYWWSPALSQHRYLTGVSCGVILGGKSPAILFVRCEFVCVQNLQE